MTPVAGVARNVSSIEEDKNLSKGAVKAFIFLEGRVILALLRYPTYVTTNQI